MFADEFRMELLALIDGYARAKRTIRVKSRLAQLLDLKGREAEVVAHQLLEAVNSVAAPHLIVRHILRHLVRRTGLLLSEDDLMARLGVAPNSPDRSKLKQLLDDRRIGYSGILAGGWRRWWSHRLLKDLRSFLKSPELFGIGANRRESARGGAEQSVRFESNTRSVALDKEDRCTRHIRLRFMPATDGDSGVGSRLRSLCAPVQ
jgi:hypothetical protein